MPLPCSGCPEREIDFGGCRCQAALIAGDSGVTDPACSLSPCREKLTAFVESIQSAGEGSSSFDADNRGISFRQNPAA
jgi:pyrroloquinoline quinone biosynthesis protein E